MSNSFDPPCLSQRQRKLVSLEILTDDTLLVLVATDLYLGLVYAVCRISPKPNVEGAPFLLGSKRSYS